MDFQNNPTYKAIVEQSDAIAKELGAKNIKEALLMLQNREKKS
jgi:hypothetical protein